MRLAAVRLVVVLGLAWSLLLATASEATPVVVDFDGRVEGDFYTTPHLEDGTTTIVDSGHYDIFSDPFGPSGDLTMNLDEQFGGLTQITLTIDGGLLFDALSVDVIDPADSVGEFTISAIGGTGNVPAPTTGGIFVFGPGFDGISGLRITQHSNGFFTFDDLTLEIVPEPGTGSLLALGLLGLARHRRRPAHMLSPARP